MTSEQEESLKQFVNENFPKMGGWCDIEKAIQIGQIVFDTKPQRIAEVGVFEGKSTLAMAHCCKLNGSGTVYAIDSWKKEDCIDDESANNQEWWSKLDLDYHYEQFVSHSVRTNLVRHIQFCRMSSWDASRFLPDMDMVHIDANHAEWPSTSDVVNWLPKLKVGGYLVMDDVNWESTQTALRFVLKRCQFISRFDLKDSVFAIYRKEK
jgi:predicted O-methyltransferase YrrM